MKYSGIGNSNNPSTLFCEQVSTVTSLFEKWNECERTVVMYALLKRLRYPTIKFLQCSIENNIINNPQTSLITRQQYLKNDLNANDINYLQKLLSSYKNDDCNYNNNNCTTNIIPAQLLTPPLTNDKDSILLYESDSSNSTSNSAISSNNNKKNIISATIQSAQLQSGNNILINHHNDKNINKKEEILKDILTMLPLLKPGNEEVKNIYLSIIPLAVEDTVRQIVATELVQQIFSYLLIHPAILNEDRKALGSWLKHLEEHIQSLFSGERSFYILTNNNSNNDSSLSKSSSVSITSSLGGGLGNGGAGIINNNNNNSINKNTWQAIAPPSSQQSQLNYRRFVQQQQMSANSIFGSSTGSDNGSGSSKLSASSGVSSITNNSIYSGSCSDWNMNLSQLTDNICDDFNRGVKLPITNKNLTKSSQNNNLGLIYDGNQVCMKVNTDNNCTSTGNTGSCNLNLTNNDDHHVSFSKNGTEIIDFDINQSCDKCNTKIVGYNSAMLCCDHQQNLHQQNNIVIGQTTKKNYADQSLSAAAALIAVPHQSELPRWSLDGKLTSLKTRRSNSLTTPAAISSASSSSSSTSSVITVNDNCSSNSSENLSQYAQKPRSYSLSIENPRGALSSSGSDTRLDDMKQQPNYLKFQTHNVGMSNIGQWLKSLRLHKYIGLFTTMTYEDMLEISEDYLQSLGVTKGASHKLALCIDKLKDRYYHLIQLEQDLLSGKITLTAIIEELTNIVLTPMKPIDSTQNNVALKFLQVLELVSLTVGKKEVNTIQDEDCVNALLWILERSIHAEAFVTHTNQLKEQKFKLSKVKAQFSPKMHPQHNKNGSNGSLNKPRWTKSRNKNDNTKSGSIDRINNRKNSHDIVNFSINTIQPQQNNTTTTGVGNCASTIHNLCNINSNDIEKYHHHNKNQSASSLSSSLVASSTNMSSTSLTSTTQPHFTINSNNINSSGNNNQTNGSTLNSCPQYKSSSYPNFANTGGDGNSCTQIPNQQHQQQQQQQIQQQHHQLQHQHNQQYRHRHSLNNLIVVSSNPQQPQQMIFKQGKGGFTKIDSPAGGGTNDNNVGGKNRRSSITQITIQQQNQSPNLDNSNIGSNAGNTLLKSNSCEKTFAEIISVSNNNNNNNGNNYNNSINNIKSSLLNCGNVINVIGGGSGDDSINGSNNCGDNNIIDTTCSNSNLTTTQSINNTNLLNQNSKDINNQKLSRNNLNDINRSLEQLEFLCLQMTEQAIN